MFANKPTKWIACIFLYVRLPRKLNQDDYKLSLQGVQTKCCFSKLHFNYLILNLILFLIIIIRNRKIMDFWGAVPHAKD